MTNLMNEHTKALVEVAKAYFNNDKIWRAGHEFTDKNIAEGIIKIATLNRRWLTNADLGQAKEFFHQYLPTPLANKI